MPKRACSVIFQYRLIFVLMVKNSGQFERSLIIVDEGASIQYIEGCTAPNYTTNSLHAATVEIMIKRDASFSLRHRPYKIGLIMSTI